MSIGFAMLPKAYDNLKELLNNAAFNSTLQFVKFRPSKNLSTCMIWSIYTTRAV